MRVRASQQILSLDHAEERGDPLRLALIFALAFVMAGLPVFLHVISQPLAIGFCVVAAVLAATKLERDVPIFVLTVTIFQNFFVALASPNFNDIASVEPLKAYSFVTTVVVWLVVMTKFALARRTFSPFVRKMVYASGALFAVYGFYFLAGLAIDARNSIVYFRNLVVPLLLFQLFLIVAARHKLEAPRIVAVLLTLLVVAGYIELFAVDFWLRLTNGWTYLTLLYAPRLTSLTELKIAAASGVVFTNVLDYSTSDPLNLPLFAGADIKLQRLLGPNFHPISFGYVLAALIVFAALHRRVLLALLAAPLLIMTNAKGPLVVMTIGVVFFLVARRRSDYLAFAGLLLTLAAYFLFVFWSGRDSGDYHVLGLMGGVNGFFNNPLGHTLAEGGNLSIQEFASLDWQRFQSQGAADFAVESGVGVMLFQLGVAAAAAFAFYAWVVWTSWRLFRVTRAPALALATGALATHLVNGAFQEEAYFAPLALGLVLAFAGLAFGATDYALASRAAECAASEAQRSDLWVMRAAATRG